MTARLPLLALTAALIAAVAVPVLAQRAPTGAAAKYRDAATQYVAGEMEPAEAAARAGLRLDPDNAKLQALLDLILQDKDEQDGDQNQDQDGDSGDDGEQQQESGDQGQDGEPEPGDQDGEQDGPQDDDEAERDGTDQGQNEQGKNDDAPQNEGGQSGAEGDAERRGQPGAQGEMSRAQAERLLDAVGGDEQLLLREMQRFQTRSSTSDKDW